MPKFSCNYCQKSFIANFNLRRHVRIFHKDNVQPEIKRGRKPKIENTVTCDLCTEKLVNKQALRYHRRRKHFSVYQKTRRRQCEKRALKFDSINGK